MALKKTEKSAAPAKKVAVKKIAVKKTAVKADASKAPATKKASAAAAKGGLTRIIVKADAGWGNSLYIRGNGAGLSWHKGVLMQCVDSAEWIWENKISKGTVEFKILINDEIWSTGDDISVKAGETATCHPTFQ